MKDRILINEFIKDKNVGAIASSSKKVVKKIVDNIDFEEAKVIVEYGPGKGTITKQLLNSMGADSVLFVFETNKDFIIDLEGIKDKKLIIINDKAENALLILRNRYKIENVDYVISTIPFTFLDRNVRRRLIYSSYALLREKGKFLTYQYTPLIYKIIKSKFRNFSIKTNLHNLPPVFIMQGIK